MTNIINSIIKLEACVKGLDFLGFLEIWILKEISGFAKDFKVFK